MADSERRRKVLSDKQRYDAARKERKLHSSGVPMDELRAQFEHGASRFYQGEPLTAQFTPTEEPVEFEEYPATSTHIGELRHTPVRDPAPASVVNELQEGPIFDAIVIDDDDV